MDLKLFRLIGNRPVFERAISAYMGLLHFTRDCYHWRWRYLSHCNGCGYLVPPDPKQALCERCMLGIIPTKHTPESAKKVLRKA